MYSWRVISLIIFAFTLTVVFLNYLISYTDWYIVYSFIDCIYYYYMRLNEITKCAMIIIYNNILLYVYIIYVQFYYNFLRSVNT